MKIYLLFYFILSFTVISAGDFVKVNEQDIADFQESTFIKLINELNRGTIPFPFKNLVESLKMGEEDGGNIVMIPDGRSLVKKFADYKNPRIVFEPFFRQQIGGGGLGMGAPSPLPNFSFLKDNVMKKLNLKEGDLYIGFAPNHKALEVISYNSKKGAYDFFIVNDYEEGKTPKIVSSKGQCISCHQNEGPIFSRFPWTESTGETASAVLKDGLVLLTNENKMMDLIRKANPDREEIEGINILKKESFGLARISAFDFSVRRANASLLSKKICEIFCQDNDSKCLKKLSIDAAKIKNNEVKDLGYDIKILNQKIDQLNFASSSIPNRDPIKNVGYQSLASPEVLEKSFVGNSFIPLKAELAPLKSNDLTFLEAGTTNIGLHELDHPRSDYSFYDPASTRPNNSNLIKLQSQYENIKDKNEKIYFLINTCLSTPADPAQLFIQQTNVEKRPPESPCNHDSYSIVPVYKTAALEKAVNEYYDQSIKKPQALLQRYCTECHSKTGFINLPLDSLGEMANYKPTFGEKGVLERLEKKIMPPSFAAFQPTAEEREEIIKALKQLKVNK